MERMIQRICVLCGSNHGLLEGVLVPFSMAPLQTGGEREAVMRVTACGGAAWGDSR